MLNQTTEQLSSAPLPLAPLSVQDKVSEEETVIDLLQYWRIVMMHKWGIAALVIIVTTLVAVIMKGVVPVYSAKSTMMIESQEAKVSSVEEIYGLNSSGKEYFLTQFEILKSRRIAERVVDLLGLMEEPEFLPKEESLFSRTIVELVLQPIKEMLPFLSQPDNESTVSSERADYMGRQKVIDAVLGRIAISPIRNTQLVKIGFESESPELAALVANTIPSVYISGHLEAKMDMTHKATAWLSERRLVLRETLADSEQRLHQFREENDLVDSRQGVEGLVSQELNQLTSQLSEARRKLSQAESIYRVVQDRSYRKLEALPEVLNHSTIQDIQRVEEAASRKVSELGRRYGPKHPKMVAAQAELSSVQANKRNQIKTLVAGIESEYESAIDDVDSLDRQLGAAKKSFQKVSRKATRFMELRREVDINQELYSTFLKRFTETAGSGDFSQANARITDSAIVPLNPSKPNKKLMVIMAMIISGIIGVMIAFLYEALHDGVRSVADVESKLSMRLLGMLPNVPHRRKKRLSTYVFFEDKARAFQEAFRSLRTSLMLSNIESSVKIITVTSTMPNEGKSTVASNLAFALGQMEKVLLIDADLRKPSLGNMFHLPSYHSGLSNLISDTASAKECIISDEQGGIDFMPAGAMPSNPQELLGSKRFEDILKALSAKYDRIILDSAPILAVGDPLLLSSLSDTVLYVVKADTVSIKAVKRGLGRLMQVGARVDGIVLNQIDANRADGYGDFQNYGYGDKEAAAARRLERKRERKRVTAA